MKHPEELVEKAAEAMADAGRYGDRYTMARAVLDAVAPDLWPCANYPAPTTCLTTPSSETGRCDHCRAQADAVAPAIWEAALNEAADAVLREFDPPIDACIWASEWLRDMAAQQREEQADGLE